MKMLRTTIGIVTVLVSCLFSQTAGAGEAGAALKGEVIKSEPFRDARTVGSLAAGDKVDILKRQGGWMQITSTKGSGWVRMLSIRRGAARKGGADAAALLGLASGRAGTGRVVATTGVRGLNEEELKAAKFDPSQLKKLESYTTSKAEAQKFAAQGKLTSRKFDYLQAPSTEQGDSTWPAN